MTVYQDQIASHTSFGKYWWKMQEAGDFACTVNGGLTAANFNKSGPGIDTQQAGPNGEEYSVLFASGEYCTFAGSSTHDLRDSHSSLTVEFWIKTSDTSGSENIALLTHRGVWEFYLNTSGQLNLYINYNSGDDNTNTGVAINDGEWHHIVARWVANTSTGNWIMIDGTVVASNFQAGAGTTVSNTYTLTMADNGGYTPQRIFDGYITHLCIYVGSLSQSDAQANYEAMVGSPDVTITQDVTDISVGGDLSTTVHISDSVTQDVTDIQILAYDAIVDSGAGNTTQTAEVTDISVGGDTDTTVTAEASVTVEAEVTDIVVDAGIASFSVVYENYDTLITAAGPTHWWRFDNTVTDYAGSLNLSGTPTYSSTNPITGTAVDAHLASGTMTTSAVATTNWGYTTTRGSTVEFFVRTTDLNGVIVWIKPTGNIGTVSSSFSYNGSTSTNTYTITWPSGLSVGRGWGVKNGYLAGFRYMTGGTIQTSSSFQDPYTDLKAETAYNTAWGTSIDSQANADWTVSEKYIADGNWHHVAVVSKYDSGTGALTHKTYVDGVALVTNIGNMFSGNFSTGSLRIGSLTVRYTDGSQTSDKQIESRITGDIDELAFYDYGLDASVVAQHYADRNGYILADPSVDVVVEETNIAVGGDLSQTVIIPKIISVTPATIEISGQSAGFTSDTAVAYGADTGLITVQGYEPTITGGKSRNITLDNQPGGVRVQTHLNTVFTTVDDLSFTFVPPTETSISAADASELVSMNMGSFLFSQEKVLKFRLANTSNFNCNYTVSAISINSEVIDNVTFSLDGYTYATTVTTSTVQPRTISDIVYVKLSIPTSLSTGDGNFLINVEPINVDATN